MLLSTARCDRVLCSPECKCLPKEALYLLSDIHVRTEVNKISFSKDRKTILEKHRYF